MSRLFHRLTRLSNGRLIALFLAMTMIPVLVLAFASVGAATDAVTKQANSRVQDTTSVTAALVHAQMKGLSDVVSAYADRPSLIHALGDGDPASYDPAGIDQQLISLHTSNAGNAVAFVSDPSGRLLGAVPPSPSIIGRDFSFRDWYRGVTSTGRTYVSEAYQSAIAGSPRVVAVAAPVRGTHGEVIGIVVAGYDVNAIQGFVKTFASVQGINVTTTDQRGTLLAGPGGLPAGLVPESSDPGVAAALQGQTGVRHISGPDGEELSGYAPVPALGWTVRAEVPASVALASVSMVRNSIVGLAIGAGIVLVGVLTLLTFVLRRRTRDQATLDAGRQRAAESDALFTLSLDMFAVASFDGQFTRLNDAWTTTLGYSLDELMSRPYVDFVHLDDRQLTDSESADLVAGELTVGFENRYRHADGSYRTLAWSARGRSEEGVIYAVARDVTAQKEAEGHLRMAQERAMEVSRLKSEFLANMSHEIRTPLNGVIGMTDLLLATPLAAEQAEYADTIRRSGDALLVVINDILDFSKIESGRLEIETVDIDLRTTVEDVAELVAAAAQQAGLEVATAFDAALPDWARGDPGRLRQVLTNLVGNAVKFTECGEVVIRAWLERDLGDVLLVGFDVRDTGIGISTETQGKLFTAFTQADSSTTRVFGGTGLGLAISSQLVSLMGGEIGVDSTLGEGSRFWFTVRLEKSARQRERRAGSSADAESILDGVRVLVVDDNQTNRTILETTLAAGQARPVGAAGGAEALELLRQAASSDPFGLVLIDYMMPAMDGLELARRITSDPQIPTPRMVLLTSAAGRSSGSTLDAGLDATLSKPVRNSSLYDCLVTIMSKAPGARADTPAPRPARGDAKRGNGATILVAEDNPVNQMVAARMLENLGYAVEVVADGAQAVQAVERRRFAAVLMDCQMPVMDGYEATAEIRKLQRNGRRLPIIAMTAAAMEEDSKRCLAAGMDAHLAKPVKSAALASVLAGHVVIDEPA